MKTVLLSRDLGEDRIREADAGLRDRARVLRTTEGDVVPLFREADAYLCVGFAREFPEEPFAYERLRFVQTTLAGVDHLPYERLPTAVAVASNAGAYNVALAEHAFALLLAAAKRVVMHAVNIWSQQFEQDLSSVQLRGSTLGVIGLGGIGREVARFGQAFGMQVAGITRSGESDFPADFVGGPGDLPRLLERSDFVVIAVPHTKETHHLIAAKELRRMRPHAVLVNVARGDIVKEEDLFNHLRDVPTFFAATDVWWRYPRGAGFPHTLPFQDLPNFFGTPHIAWNVPPQRMVALRAAVENLRAWLDGRPARNLANASDYR